MVSTDNLTIAGIIPVNNFASNAPYGTAWNGIDDDGDWAKWAEEFGWGDTQEPGEWGYINYHDINDSTNPIEAGLKWVVDLSKEKFIGKNAIEKIYIEKPAKQLVCFEMQERGIPRKSYNIYSNDEKIGFVTSGTFSTNLNKGIGLGYVDSIKIKDDIFDIKIRNKFIKANIIKPPFITNYSLHD